MTDPSSPPLSPASEIESLPDSAPSSDIDSSTTSDEEESDAEKEWKESLQQLELLLTMVLVPFVGKYFGKKCAYWGGFFFFCYISLVQREWKKVWWIGEVRKANVLE